MRKILITMTKFHGFFGMFACIFDSMLKIFITQSNRELSICDRVRKMLSLMTKICMVSLLYLCVLLEMKMKTQKTYL